MAAEDYGLGSFDGSAGSPQIPATLCGLTWMLEIRPSVRSRAEDWRYGEKAAREGRR